MARRGPLRGPVLLIAMSGLLAAMMATSGCGMAAPSASDTAADAAAAGSARPTPTGRWEPMPVDTGTGSPSGTGGTGVESDGAADAGEAAQGGDGADESGGGDRVGEDGDADDENPADGVTYAFELPPNDESVSNHNPDAYRMLLESCDRAEAFLEFWIGERFLVDDYPYFLGARFPMLFAAGIAACRDDRQTASALLQEARDRYGVLGLVGDAECQLYIALASYVDRMPKESFSCPAGPLPQFEYVDGVLVHPLKPSPEPSVPPDGSTGTETPNTP
ncbi:hypothetical protein ACDF64_05495 [Agromyces sp. MMS24-JH15]|uniref:hypothetical protein n=1 Tax=Agromyces sp. MMS24-JH15 TaxID=3243765 RepID=UPI003748AA53